MSETEIPRVTARQVLDLPMPDNDAHAATIREYLITLLATLWDEQDSFSGAKPFGNSGWDWDLYPPLIKEGLIYGRIDEFGYIDDVDDKAGQRMIAAAIAELGRTD